MGEIVLNDLSNLVLPGYILTAKLTCRSQLHIQQFTTVITTTKRLIVQVDRVFANGPGDLGSIPDRVIPKTLKMLLDTSLLNTQQYKVRIKGKVEQSREMSSALPYTLL